MLLRGLVKLLIGRSGCSPSLSTHQSTHFGGHQSPPPYEGRLQRREGRERQGEHRLTEQGKQSVCTSTRRRGVELAVGVPKLRNKSKASLPPECMSRLFQRHRGRDRMESAHLGTRRHDTKRLD